MDECVGRFFYFLLTVCVDDMDPGVLIKGLGDRPAVDEEGTSVMAGDDCDLGSVNSVCTSGPIVIMSIKSQAYGYIYVLSLPYVFRNSSMSNKSPSFSSIFSSSAGVTFVGSNPK